MAQFDHHTSRDLDPQLHTHSFVFNLAPRQDGSWGAIVSRDLYKAQKGAGAVYRRELANELERLGHHLDRQEHGFRVAAVPHNIERAFSKRRQAIEDAARTHGYRTAKGMEIAALRTRRAKQNAKLDNIFKTWQTEAKALGFELRQDQTRACHVEANTPDQSAPSLAVDRTNPQSLPHSTAAQTTIANFRQTAARIGHQLGHALQALKQPSGMPGLKPKLRKRDRERERE